MSIHKLNTNDNNVQNTVSLNEEAIKNVTNITIIAALAIIPLVFVPLGGKFDHFYLPKVIAMFALVISFLLMNVLKKQSIKDLIQNDWINKFLLIYLILLIVSVFFAGNINLAIFGTPSRYEGLITIVLYMGLFIIARSFTKLNDKFFMLVLRVAVIVSFYGILQTLGIDPFPRDVLRVNWGSRAFSTMGNPNFLGSYLVLMIPITIYLYIIKENKFGLIGYIILFYCLLSTNTRGAWLGAIASMFCFTALHYKYYKYKKSDIRSYIILFIITLSIVLLFNYNSDGSLLKRFLTITEDAEEFLTDGEKSDFTGAHRGFIWKRVVELIKIRPLTGYGIENLGETFKKYYSQDMMEFWGEVRYADKAHNEYLNIAVTSGVPSLIAYLTFVILIIRKGLKNLTFNSINLLLLSSVIGYITAAFFNISVVSVVYAYWIFLGFIASDYFRSSSKELKYN